jgi:hypothetical protein
MPVQKFMKWHQKMLLGASLKVTAPTGQYDPTNDQLGRQSLGLQTGVWMFSTLGQMGA